MWVYAEDNEPTGFSSLNATSTPSVPNRGNVSSLNATTLDVLAPVFASSPVSFPYITHIVVTVASYTAFDLVVNLNKV